MSGFVWVGRDILKQITTTRSMLDPSLRCLHTDSCDAFGFSAWALAPLAALMLSFNLDHDSI